MPTKKSKILTGLIAVFCVIMFALIRQFEDVLFYDPFLAFFKGEFAGAALPGYDGLQLLGSLAFRYGLNTLVSLVLIYALFRNKDQLRFAAVLYAFFFVLLIIAFFAVIKVFGNSNLTVLFYIRRFLIQPLWVILFLPAFYYQERLSKK